MKKSPKPVGEKNMPGHNYSEQSIFPSVEAEKWYGMRYVYPAVQLQSSIYPPPNFARLAVVDSNFVMDFNPYISKLKKGVLKMHSAPYCACSSYIELLSRSTISSRKRPTLLGDNIGVWCPQALHWHEHRNHRYLQFRNNGSLEMFLLALQESLQSPGYAQASRAMHLCRDTISQSRFFSRSTKEIQEVLKYPWISIWWRIWRQ